jgi:hypothetical protein
MNSSCARGECRALHETHDDPAWWMLNIPRTLSLLLGITLSIAASSHLTRVPGTSTARIPGLHPRCAPPQPICHRAPPIGQLGSPRSLPHLLPPKLLHLAHVWGADPLDTYPRLVISQKHGSRHCAPVRRRTEGSDTQSAWSNMN